jgi:hypothetical protein
MFWILWLPLFMLAIFVLYSLVNALLNNNTHKIGKYVFKGFKWALITLLGGLFFNVMVMSSAPVSPYPDLNNPVYLARAPETPGNVYLISTDDLAKGKIYHYYFIADNKTGISQSDSISSDAAHLVEDNPSRPFYVKIKYTCKFDRLWSLWCINTSPYSLEFHLPKDSIKNY